MRCMESIAGVRGYRKEGPLWGDCFALSSAHPTLPSNGMAHLLSFKTYRMDGYVTRPMKQEYVF